MKLQPDQLEAQIEEHLAALVSNADKLGDSDTAWTRAIKNSLGRLGASLGYTVYASQCDFANAGEWLFDLVWAEEEDDWLRRVPLVMESEWKPYRELWDDFEKLMVARADHRLMVLWAPTEKKGRETVGELVEGIEACNMTEPGDRYLFACWVDDLERFVTRRYVVPGPMVATHA